MAFEQNSDTVACLARDLAARIRWEHELGAAGYDPRDTVLAPQPVSTPPPVSASPLSPVSDASSGPADIARSPIEVNASEALVALRDEIGDCRRCGLANGRHHLVFGEGNPDAKLVFVGEGPGRDEDLQGRPFVGAAGQLLDRIVRAMTLDRESVYICNVVKCRPPNNRTPDPEERRLCGEFVRRQLAIIKPKVVVALGSTAAQYLLSSAGSLGSLRGRFHEMDGIKVMPTYHPAYLLRNPGGKRAVWEDMQKVMAILDLSKDKE